MKLKLLLEDIANARALRFYRLQNFSSWQLASEYKAEADVASELRVCPDFGVKSEVDNYMLNYSPNILKPDLSNVNKTAFDGEVAKSQTIADLSNKLDNYAFTNKNGNDFKANKLTSPLDDLHFTENNGIAEVNINPKLLEEHHKEGLYYQLGNDEQINSKYNKARIYFRNPIIKGAGRVCQDINSKSFIIQNINIIDDPDINNGTTFILAANFEPTKNSLPITQDGQIKFTFCDDEDKPLYDINGDECASEILYKSGDMPKREVLLSVVKVTTQKKVHLKIY